MNVIKGIPDEWRDHQKKVRKYAGPEWLASIGKAFASPPVDTNKFFTVDLSNLDFVTLSAWVGAVAFMEKLITKQLASHIGIDLKGTSDLPLLSPSEYTGSRHRLSLPIKFHRRISQMSKRASRRPKQ